MGKWQMVLIGGWALEMAYLAGLAVRLTRWALAKPERHELVTGTLEFEGEGAYDAQEARAATASQRTQGGAAQGE